MTCPCFREESRDRPSCIRIPGVAAVFDRHCLPVRCDLPPVCRARDRSAFLVPTYPNTPECGIIGSRSLKFRQAVHRHQSRQFGCPSEQDRSLRRQRRQFPQQPSRIVRNKPLNQLLTVIADDSMQKKGVALQQNRGRKLGRPPGRQNEAQPEFFSRAIRSKIRQQTVAAS